MAFVHNQGGERPLTGADEGLSLHRVPRQKVLLKEAIETEGDRILGAP